MSSSLPPSAQPQPLLSPLTIVPREHASSTVIPTQPTNDDMDVDVEAGDASAGDYDVLIRCTDGVDINFSTKVSVGQVPGGAE